MLSVRKGMIGKNEDKRRKDLQATTSSSVSLLTVQSAVKAKSSKLREDAPQGLCIWLGVGVLLSKESEGRRREVNTTVKRHANLQATSSPLAERR